MYQHSLRFTRLYRTFDAIGQCSQETSKFASGVHEVTDWVWDGGVLLEGR